MPADSRSDDRQHHELREAARARLLAAPASPENDLAQDEHERFWRTHDTAAGPVADYVVRLSARFTVPAGHADPEGVAATAVTTNDWLLAESEWLSEEGPLTVTGSVRAPAVWPNGTGPSPVLDTGAWCRVLLEVDQFGADRPDGMLGLRGPEEAEAAAVAWASSAVWVLPDGVALGPWEPALTVRSEDQSAADRANTARGL